MELAERGTMKTRLGDVAISVCIANYNGRAIIDACIASIKAQEFSLPVEIIVHDDASGDDSADYIEKKHPEVTLIRSAANVGFCVANNRMVKAARGQYVLLLNNDAELLPDALCTLHGEAAALERQAILSLPQYDHGSGALIDNGCFVDPFLNPVPNLNLACRDVGVVIGACLWIPKDLWTELGGFPDWFGSIGEDLYLCCRARLAGYPVKALGISGYRHRVGNSFGGGKVDRGRLVTTFRRRALSERNKTFVMLATYPLLLLAVVLPLHLVLLLVEGSVLAVVRRQGALLSKIYLPVFGAVIRRQREIRILRQTAQGVGHISTRRYLAAVTFWPHKLRLLLRHGVPKVN